MALTEPVNTDVVRLRLRVAMDGLTVSVGPGRTFLPGSAGTPGVRLIQSDGTASVTLAAPAANTWYYAYAYEASSGVLGLELSTTTFSTPYPGAGGTARTKSGDTTRRYLMSMRTDGSGKLRPMSHTCCQSLGNVVMFSAASATGSVPVTLAGITAITTAQLLDLSAIIPSTATHVRLQVRNNSNFQVYLSNPDVAAASPTNYSATVNPGASDSMEIEVGALQKLSMIISPTSLLGGVLGALLTGSVSITVQGYLFDR